jgi:hypothetical protein
MAQIQCQRPVGGARTAFPCEAAEDGRGSTKVEVSGFVPSSKRTGHSHFAATPVTGTLTASVAPTILAPLHGIDAMRKPTQRKASAKKAPDPHSVGHGGAKHRGSQQRKTSVTLDNEGKLNFNHAMVYVKDVERGLSFYRDLLGFKLIEDFRYEKKPVYARLRARAVTVRSPSIRRLQKRPF